MKIMLFLQQQAQFLCYLVSVARQIQAQVHQQQLPV
jgi:hypothetical protein